MEMVINMYIDLGIQLGIFILSLLCTFIYFACKADNAKYAKMLKDDQDWLAAEMKKPKWRVLFKVSGHSYCSQIAEPLNSLEGFEWNMRRTSKGLAHAYLTNFYERGYFTDTAGNTYPACNVQMAKLDEVESV
jgi:hypothetical protein